MHIGLLHIGFGVFPIGFWKGFFGANVDRSRGGVVCFVSVLTHVYLSPVRHARTEQGLPTHRSLGTEQTACPACPERN